MYKYGVVVIGYKNVIGIKRLLRALGKAEYYNESVKLIISIDQSDCNGVKKIADAFEWKFGEKYVITFAEKLGLREHVMHCGDYLNIYNLDSLAVFEDDTLPSQSFFQFMKAATEKYITDENIAGVSLYTDWVNYNVTKKFIPVKNSGDVFFMQNAQSRGQIWFRKQWNEFRKWYNEQISLEDDYTLPRYVTSWPETSWKKYYIKYCVVKNKYFVYPYVSFSTCFGDVGEHVRIQTNGYQVPISGIYIQSEDFNLLDFDDKALKYDVFFENQNLYLYCNVEKEDLLVDLYGNHLVTEKKYILTKKKLPYRILKSWGNELIPHEMNLICDIHGNEIFLYEVEDDKKLLRLPEQIIDKSKPERYFDILDQWMTMEECGRTVEDYFLKRQWKSIAIYGCGKMGKHLYAKLNNSSINVEYFIDQHAYTGENDIEIKRLSDNIPVVDVIVVTPILELDEIKTELQREGYSYPVVSIEDIIYDSIK